jgi:tetratricopeptide (TPR) repeat protein
MQKAQDQVRKEIERTNNADYETDQLELLRMLRGEELGVRQLVAEQHYARKQFDLALAQLDRILELDPRRTTDYYNRGRVLLEVGRAEEAKADFRRFLADPTVPSNSDKAAFALKAIER